MQLRKHSGWTPIAISLFLFILLFSLKLSEMASYSFGFQRACDLVYENYYEESPRLNKWYESCQNYREKEGLLHSQKFWLQSLNSYLAQLDASHLEVFAPSEYDATFEGVLKENGLRARSVNDRWVVYEVITSSPAELSGFQLGDSILNLDGISPYSQWQVQNHSGKTSVLRGKVELTLELKVEKLKAAHPFQVKELENSILHAKLKSFRRPFVKNPWAEHIDSVKKSKGIIIDLRDNLGGDFGNLISYLSLFFCEPTRIGSFSRPRETENRVDEFPVEGPWQKQIAYIRNHKQLELITQKQDYCYTKPIVVLVNEKSASTSEIFASAILEAKRGKVLGESTAGSVLVGVWHYLNDLGKGYTLVVPEALFLSRNGNFIEAMGVEPNQWLEYRLKDALRGEDSWILDAMKELNRN